jgi:polyhydroxyalkanoate synthesis regulator phasin
MSAIKNGAALSQPAEERCVVDDALDRMRHAPPQLWEADLIGQQISVKRMRDILAFALAHATAPLQAEIEALRAEVQALREALAKENE